MKSSKDNIRSFYNTIKGRVPNLKNAAAMIVTILFVGAVIFGQTNKGMGNMDSASLAGTVTLEIPSDGGSVRVTLPDDIRAGDTISGTVYFPANVVEGEVVDIKTVDGEVVAVKSSGPGEKMFKFVVPAGLASIPFLLKSASGKHIGTAVLNVNDKFSGNIPTQLGSAPDIPTQRGRQNGALIFSDYDFAPPRLGQTGRSISIPGKFDGNAGSTTVNIGGKQAPVIAESPRQSVVRIPADTPTGPGELTIRENQGSPQTSKFNVVSIQLKADKLNLLKGEKTNLYMFVTGLEGWSFKNDDVMLRLENATPQVVHLSFSREFQSSGAAGTVMMRRVNTNSAGSVNYTETLTGVSPGAFAINALLFAPPPKGKNKNKEKEEVIDPGSLRGRLKRIADLKRKAANATTNSDAKNDLEKNAKKLEGMVNDKTNWDDKGGTKHLDGLIKVLNDEKKELDKKLVQVGADSEAGKKIIEAKGEIDEALKAAEAEKKKK